MLRRGEELRAGLRESAADALPTAGAVCAGGSASGYRCRGVDLLARVPVRELGNTGSDVWGWTDPASGREFALSLQVDRTAFVEVTAPFRPKVLAFMMSERGGESAWRDAKVFANTAYVVADGITGHGMQVFDLERLRGLADFAGELQPDFVYREHGAAHNIVLNEATGFAYAVGSDTCLGGLHVVDLRQDRLRPAFVGCVSDGLLGDEQPSRRGYTHDAQCVVYSGPDARFAGRELCFAFNEDRVVVFDVSDKSEVAAGSSAALLSAAVVSSTPYNGAAYTHQGWLTEDQRFLLLDDELDETGRAERTKTYLFNVTVLTEPRFMGVSLSPEVAIDHNLYVRGDKAYMSNYRAGLRVNDLSAMMRDGATQLDEVAFFDTVRGVDEVARFGGAFSSYVYFPSGNLVVNDMAGGLSVLREQSAGALTPGPTASPQTAPPAAWSTPAPTPSPSGSPGPVAANQPTSGPTASPTPAADDAAAALLSTAGIAGIAGGCAAVVLAAAAATAVLCRVKRRELPPELNKRSLAAAEM